MSSGMDNGSKAAADCIFITDLHGRKSRYEKLANAIIDVKPSVVFLGGDLLPHAADGDFLESFLIPHFCLLQEKMGDAYPRVFLIPGNDDPRSCEQRLRAAEQDGLWIYAHNRRIPLGDFSVFGYACVPPTPFRLKDWERYDVSRYVDPGCISPEEGVRTVPVEPGAVKWGTIAEDLAQLAGAEPLEKAVFLFHSPPYRILDRAALDGRMVDHAPLDVHVGSIAIQRFIESRQPLLTLHGHIHESVRLTGEWKVTLGRTTCLGGAHDGPELALIRFSLQAPWTASRELI